MAWLKRLKKIWWVPGCLLFLELVYYFWPRPIQGHIPPHPHVAARRTPNFDKRPKSNALVDAAGRGDILRMKRLLDSGVSPDAGSTGDEGISAMTAAADSGSVPAIQLLMERGADINDEDAWGGNALTDASLSGDVTVVKFLIDHGCDPNANDDGATALGYAEHQLVYPETKAPRENYEAIVRMLKEAGGRQTSPGAL